MAVNWGKVEHERVRGDQICNRQGGVFLPHFFSLLLRDILPSITALEGSLLRVTNCVHCYNMYCNSWVEVLLYAWVELGAL